MKKHLSFILLSIGIFNFNTLPAQADWQNSAVTLGKATDFNEIVGDQWCLEFPWMGLFCWKL